MGIEQLHALLAQAEQEHRRKLQALRATDHWHSLVALEAQIALLRALIASADAPPVAAPEPPVGTNGHTEEATPRDRDETLAAPAGPGE